MLVGQNKKISLDKFIYKSLYDKDNGYYIKKNPFGKKGDFITSPNISVLFSEMISIWLISFWENLKKPKKINIVELGACLLYTSPSPRDRTRSRMPSSA